MKIQVRTNRDSWQMVPVAEIMPYENNSKPHSQVQIQQLRESLRTMGFIRPLLLDEERRLMVGHGVLQAAEAEGMDAVPCVIVSGLTENQRRAYIHLDNLLGEMTSTDVSLLMLDLPVLEEVGICLESLGIQMPDALPPEPVDLDSECKQDPQHPDKVYHCPKCGFTFEA